MAAIHVACNSLWLRDCDTALAGGVNIMTNPDIFSGLSKGQFLSKVGPCQTFDDAADGYCRGDAVGSLVLKRLSDAEADNDNILGVIMSVATNHSADAISITHPHAGTQEILYKRVLSHAGVQPQEVSYVEMHGTGTQAGDATEMSSVSGVFAPPSLSRKVNEKLYLGSVKANVGHGEASSGVTAIVKVLLMMQHNTIPPHVGIKRDINRGFPDLAARNVYISKEPVSFPRPQSGTRKIFVNNFSAAGGNTAVMMEDGTARQLQGSDPRQAHVVAVSGRALSSLKLNLKNLAEHLTSHPNLSLPSLSYSTTARKIQHNYRFSVAGSNIASIKQALMDAAQSDILPVPAAPKIAFVFTGQGSMYAGIGAELFQTCTAYRESILEFDSIATGFGFPSIRALADGTDDGVISNLAPVLVQVAQVSIQMAMTRVWQAFGVCPDVVVGHSLGEYAALFASGILSASDTIFLVGSRAKLLESHCTSGSHAMLAIRGEMSSWRDLVPSDRFQIACMNSNTEIVLSGLADDIESCQSLLQGHGIQATKLNVPFAFHSSQVDPILGPFAQICSEVTFRKPICEVLSPLLGRPLEETTINADYCCRHARETVNFCEALSTSMSSNTIDASTVFVEVGPHPVCTGFIKSTLGASVAAFPSFHRKSKPWETLASSTSGLSNKGVNINWGEYHRDFESALELLKLPAYGWALSNYWIDYKNDWCLTKGLVMSAAKPVAILPSISTTSVQRVVKEEFTGTCNMVSAETDISRPDVKAVLSGHMVNGIPLCPSTLYADIGMTIGKYMYQRMFPDCKSEDLPCMNVCDMAVPKTLIGRESTSHVIKILAEATKSKDSINVAISSEEGEHASFKIQFGTASVWLEEWKRTGYLVEARMNALRENSDTSNTHVLQQTIAYKLFSSFVDYEKTFQGIKKVYLDPEHWEATAEVVLEVPNADQTFDVPPYWIDSIGHLSGFILNVQPTDDSKKNVFVSHGWQSLRLSQNLVPGRKYQTYVRMVEIKGTNLISGDVYCLENSQVIGLFGGVTFMRIPRTVLDQVLPRARPRATMARATNVDERQPTKARQEGISKPNGIIPNAASTTVAVKGLAHSLSVASQVLAIVAEECGVDQNELADPNSFADLGVDSLMQLAISSRMREEMELEVASSLFLSHPTVGALKEYLRQLEPEDALSTPASSSASELNSPSDDGLGSPTTSLASNDADELAIGSLEIHDEKKLDTSNEVSAPVVHPLTLSALIPNKKATSFLLQGNIKTATTKLFLFPDGGGSAASYAHIPDLSSDVVVFGLNSPFMTTPEEYTCGVSGMARYYLEEIRRRQPQGPYNFGVSLSVILFFSLRRRLS
jgi:iterative type I PKS product template protein